MSPPIVFEPLYKERVWGGRVLETLYGRSLPDGEVPYGESWEIVDRPDDQSVVKAGPETYRGRTLHDLWTREREAVFGVAYADARDERFPLLVKILDARDRLSIQVHPPPEQAVILGGEPKTEMWYIAHAEDGAKLYVGLKSGIDRAAFQEGLAAGQTEEQVHVIRPKAGQFIFIPSGRLHAIGAGLVIYEIQQNSDTTYRVFDWNRPRPLHVEESLQCIDFSDVEPAMGIPNGQQLVDCPFFRVEQWSLSKDAPREVGAPFAIVTVVAGRIECGGTSFEPGDFFLVPANLQARRLVTVDGPASVLVTTLPA